MSDVRKNQCAAWGRAKLAFATQVEANAECVKRDDPGLHSYACSDHGWHIGNELSRALRAKIKLSRKLLKRHGPIGKRRKRT